MSAVKVTSRPMMLGVEGLEDRLVPARVVIEGGDLLIDQNVNGDSNDWARVRQVGETYIVDWRDGRTGAVGSANFAKANLVGGGLDVKYVGGRGNDSFKNFSDLQTFAFGGAGNDILQGSSGDTFIHQSGDDSLSGGDGNDLLFGKGGVDALDGGEGHDTMWGGAGDDDLIGGEGNDFLYGGFGYDEIDGHGGNDFLDGGEEDGHKDWLRGGLGADRFLEDLVLENGVLVNWDNPQDFNTSQGDLLV